MSFILVCAAIITLCLPISPQVARSVAMVLAILALVLWAWGSRGHLVLLA